jgi:hypothetical protein
MLLWGEPPRIEDPRNSSGGTPKELRSTTTLCSDHYAMDWNISVVERSSLGVPPEDTVALCVFDQNNYWSEQLASGEEE